MSKYEIHFEWQAAVDAQDPPRRALSADDCDKAKLEAALLYACGPFDGPPPSAYSIREDGAEVYRYPEVN